MSDMDGAIFYATRYGSTAQYAKWISDATGLPMLDVKEVNSDVSKYDFLVLGCPVIYHKLMIRKWVQRNLTGIEAKPIIMFTVSGAPAGAKLDGWIANSPPQEFIGRMQHVALLGRQNPDELRLFDRIMLIIGGLINPDPVASREELKGFDFMDRASIEPIVNLITKYQLANNGRSKLVDSVESTAAAAVS